MKINLTAFDSYREIIKYSCKKLELSYRTIANNTGIHTSYFSRVMVDKADFSKEQLYLISKIIGLNDWEIDYFLLLGEHDSSGNSGHKQFLLDKINKFKEEKQKVLENLNAKKDLTRKEIELYYKEPTTATIHMYLTRKKFRDNVNLIAKKLLISDRKLKSEIDKLVECGLIKIFNGDIEVVNYGVHLDESDPISSQNHINWRLETIQNLNKRDPRPSDYHMSALFSANEEIKIQIKNLFKEFVINAQKIATSKNQENKEVYHISFDLY